MRKYWIQSYIASFCIHSFIGAMLLLSIDSAPMKTKPESAQGEDSFYLQLDEELFIANDQDTSVETVSPVALESERESEVALEQAAEDSSGTAVHNSESEGTPTYYGTRYTPATVDWRAKQRRALVAEFKKNWSYLAKDLSVKIRIQSVYDRQSEYIKILFTPTQEPEEIAIERVEFINSVLIGLRKASNNIRFTHEDDWILRVDS